MARSNSPSSLARERERLDGFLEYVQLLIDADIEIDELDTLWSEIENLIAQLP